MSERDGLEVRRLGNGWAVWDTLSERFLTSAAPRRYWTNLELQDRRASYRPLIVRWLYGLPTAESKALGVTEDA